MKPIFDENLYCMECGKKISTENDFFLGHVCDDCYALDFLYELETVRYGWWNYLTDVAWDAYRKTPAFRWSMEQGENVFIKECQS